MQQFFVAHVAVRLTNDRPVLLERNHMFKGSKRVFINRVFVVFIELQQPPRMSEFRDDFFQHRHLVQSPQGIAEPLGVGEQRHEAASTILVELDARLTFKHLVANRDPGSVFD